MTTQEIRDLTIENMDSHVGGTGLEEEFRNVMMRELCAQLSELNRTLTEIAITLQARNQ